MIPKDQIIWLHSRVARGGICTAATQHLTPTSELCSNSIGPTQQIHDVATTSLQRRCVVTLQRRCNDVVCLLDIAQQETNSCVCVCVHTGATSGNVPLDMCAQRRFWSNCAHAQFDQQLHFYSQGCRFCMRTTETLIRLRGCAGSFESSRDAYVRSCVLTIEANGSFQGC